MDLVKTTLGAFLGIALTIYVVSQHEEQRRREAFAWQAEQSLRFLAVQEFSRASIAYRFGAYDSTRDQLRGLLSDHSAATRKWRTETYPSLKFAQSLIDYSFPNGKEKAARLDALTEAAGKIFSAHNAAPLFPLKKMPAQCDNKEEVNDAWETYKAQRGKQPLRVLTLRETGKMWEIYNRECLDSVLKAYDNASAKLAFYLKNNLR